ncbi:MAG: DUF3313 domain-containing protein [Planctomycetota bacterium]|jgi:hypothetical protein
MKSSLKIFAVVTICFALTIAAGCTAKQVRYSGFLENYPEFTTGPRGSADFIYIKEGVDFKVYNKILMDPVVFYFNDDSKYKGIHPDELKELSDTFHEAIAASLEGAYPLVDKPGSDVLHIRLALTDLVASKPALKTINTVMSVGRGAKVQRRVASINTYFGQASMEAELLDSQTDVRLAAVIDTKVVEKFKDAGEINKWMQAKDAFKFWSKRLRLWLDKTHGIK